MSKLADSPSNSLTRGFRNKLVGANCIVTVTTHPGSNVGAAVVRVVRRGPDAQLYDEGDGVQHRHYGRV